MSDLRPLTIRKTWEFYGKTDYNDMTCRNSNNHKKMKIHLFKQMVLKIRPANKSQVKLSRERAKEKGALI